MELHSQLLPFTPFERYMLEDDRPSHPMAFFLRFQIAKPLSVERLRQAVDQLKPVHLLPYAVIRRQGFRLFWDLGKTAPSVLGHEYGGYAKSRSDWGFDLKRESGLRLSVGNDGEACEVWLQVHHTCSDARGVLDYFRDLLAIYHGRASESKPDPSFDSTSEKARTNRMQISHTGFGRSKSYLPYLWPGSHHWRRVLGYYLHKISPLRLSSRRAEQLVSHEGPAFISRQIKYSDLGAKKSRAPVESNDGSASTLGGNEVSQVTLNDRLLAATFCALRDWHSRFEEGTGARWIRLAVPIDQRQSHASCTTVKNRSSLVFLDRHTTRIEKQDAFLNSVSDEMQRIKKMQLSTVFIDALDALSVIPQGIQLATRDRRCAITAVVSNVGHLDEELKRSVRPGSQVQGRKPHSLSSEDRLSTEGRLSITASESEQSIPAFEYGDFLVPLRPGTQFSVGILGHREHLNICLHYDSRLVTAVEATALLDDIVRALLDSTQAAAMDSGKK